MRPATPGFAASVVVPIVLLVKYRPEQRTVARPGSSRSNHRLARVKNVRCRKRTFSRDVWLVYVCLLAVNSPLRSKRKQSLQYGGFGCDRGQVVASALCHATPTYGMESRSRYFMKQADKDRNLVKLSNHTFIRGNGASRACTGAERRAWG